MRPDIVAAHAVVTVAVQSEPLSEIDSVATVRSARSGAVVQFSGLVRDNSVDDRGVAIEGVDAIDYEVYESFATERMSQIAHAAARRWPDVEAVAMWHRSGMVSVGEASVVVTVAAGHRVAAFHAASFCIDVLKVAVPIWKREHHAGGAEWVGTGHAIADVTTAAAAWRLAPDVSVA